MSGKEDRTGELNQDLHGSDRLGSKAHTLYKFQLELKIPIRTVHLQGERSQMGRREMTLKQKWVHYLSELVSTPHSTRDGWSIFITHSRRNMKQQLKEARKNIYRAKNKRGGRNVTPQIRM
ncbi:hypothetical protein KY285_005436 [Solanum tuberosum]|nr:hypothetical protein KY284_005647 [Solanum tuberosum]KAH0752288.1 hypothetical protein KY285_005436 [Solanum tuberosum]